MLFSNLVVIFPARAAAELKSFLNPVIRVINAPANSALALV